MNNLPILYRYEVHKLLELNLIWTFELEMECEKNETVLQRPEFIKQYIEKLSKMGIPYILKRGDREFNLSNGFKFKF